MSAASQEPTRDNTDSAHVASTQNVIVPVTQRSQGTHAAEEAGELSAGGELHQHTNKLILKAC